MSTRKPRPLFVAVIILALAALACGPRRATPIVIPTAAPQAGEASPTPTLPPPPLPVTGTPPIAGTPVPDVTAEGGCTLNAAYVADVTVPDNTSFAPGTAFVKTWRVRNSGTCDWEAGTKLAFASGDHMGGPVNVSLGALAAGSTIDVSVNLVAPPAPGTYKGNWQMENPEGTRFGSIVYVQIVVPAPVTNTPTPTTTPTAGPCVAPNATLKPVLDHAESLGYDMGCPTAPAFSVSGAFQEFWTNVTDPNPHVHYRSLMIWRSDNKEIYVIDGENTDASQGMLLAYTDFWLEGQPDVHPDCASLTPPTGYQLPIRGFGKIWCQNNLKDAVGWPSVHEVGVNLLVQPMQFGLLLKVSGPIPIFYLIALDYQGVLGVTQMVSP